MVAVSPNGAGAGSPGQRPRWSSEPTTIHKPGKGAGRLFRPFRGGCGAGRLGLRPGPPARALPGRPGRDMPPPYQGAAFSRRRPRRRPLPLEHRRPFPSPLRRRLNGAEHASPLRLLFAAAQPFLAPRGHPSRARQDRVFAATQPFLAPLRPGVRRRLLLVRDWPMGPRCG